MEALIYSVSCVLAWFFVVLLCSEMAIAPLFKAATLVVLNLLLVWEWRVVDCV
jgi:hypothetical protein